MHALSLLNTLIQNVLHLCVEFSEGQNSVKPKSDSTEALKGIFQLDIFVLNINFLTPCWFGCCTVQKAIANTCAEVGIVSAFFIIFFFFLWKKVKIKMAEPFLLSGKRSSKIPDNSTSPLDKRPNLEHFSLIWEKSVTYKQ